MSQRQFIVFIDYIPAELKENKVWYVEYYAKNPYTKKLERKRNRVKPQSTKSKQRVLAKQMIKNINKRRESGWNPFLQEKGTKELTLFTDACQAYINRVEADYRDGNLRKDTFKTYKSRINLIKNYVFNVVENENLMCFEFNQDFISEYLDYIRYIKKLQPRTRDNHLTFLNTFSNFLLEKKYIISNPAKYFSRINKKEKKRTIIDEDTRELIFSYWKNKNNEFLTLCLTCYFCLVRRTELTKLKVKDINLNNQTLFIDASDSKNRKSSWVTIPNQLFNQLYEHVKGKQPMEYIFSNKKFAPGLTRLSPDMITKKWRLMRKDLNLPNNIDWYSLKDTGITDLLKAGVPLLSVRDQARHHSSNQTDSYTPREMRNADENIRDSGISFKQSRFQPLPSNNP